METGSDGGKTNLLRLDVILLLSLLSDDSIPSLLIDDGYVASMLSPRCCCNCCDVICSIGTEEIFFVEDIRKCNSAMIFCEEILYELNSFANAIN